MFRLLCEFVAALLICWALSMALLNEGTIMNQATAYRAITGVK